MYIQDALYKNNTDAVAAARAIDLYKADTGKEKPRLRNQRQRPLDVPLQLHQKANQKRSSQKVR